LQPRDLARFAALACADFEVWDLTDVPLEECIARDAARTGKARVGEEMIRCAHQRYLKGKPYPLPLPQETADPADAAASSRCPELNRFHRFAGGALHRERRNGTGIMATVTLRAQRPVLHTRAVARPGNTHPLLTIRSFHHHA
jgi:hypothetical protein